MRYLMIVLSCVCAVAAAGPVGDYLGFDQDFMRAGEHQETLYMHILFPQERDSFQYIRTFDTTTIAAETLYEGLPAWVLQLNLVQDTTQTTMLDTAVEYGDSLLRLKLVLPEKILDTTLWLNLYQVPFQVGQWWEPGLAGTYYTDVDGNGLPDTVDIWGDTIKVLGQEHVTVPAHRFFDCYKLEIFARQSLQMAQGPIVTHESSYVRIYQWYKPGFGWVKDSVSIDAKTYMYVIGRWYHMSDMVVKGTGQLTGYSGAAVREERRGRIQLEPLVVRPSPFTGRTSIILGQKEPANLTRVSIFDRTGRLVRSLAARSSLSWDGRDSDGTPLPPGVYMVRTPERSCLVTKIE